MSNQERRSSRRERVFLKGRIVFNNRNSVVDCLVKDLSSTGAHIVLEHPVSIPQIFELEIPSKKWWLACERQWSQLKTHGLIFTGLVPDEVSSIERTTQRGTASELQAGGWLVRVAGSENLSLMQLFAVAGADPTEALALVVKHGGAAPKGSFELLGPLSAPVVSRLKLEPGQVLTVSDA